MLNKDLFGKIPVTSEAPKDFNPRFALMQQMQNPSPDFRKNPEGIEVYHGTHADLRPEFMKAPVIHVGSADQAAQRINPHWSYKTNDDDEPLYDGPEDVPNVQRLAISPHAKIHPVTVPDDIANEAHAHFLQEKGHIRAHTKSTDKIVLTSSQIYPSRETFYLKVPLNEN